MDTKLTLTLDSQVIEHAKAAARQSGRSLSDLIENYLITFVALHKGKEYPLPDPGSSMVAAESAVPGYSSRLLGLKGIVKDDGRDYKQQLAGIKKKKYLE
jgi:hypothetical protein